MSTGAAKQTGGFLYLTKYSSSVRQEGPPGGYRVVASKTTDRLTFEVQADTKAWYITANTEGVNATYIAANAVSTDSKTVAASWVRHVRAGTVRIVEPSALVKPKLSKQEQAAKKIYKDTYKKPKFKIGDKVQDKGGLRTGVVGHVGAYDEFLGGYRYKVQEPGGPRNNWNEKSMVKICTRKS